MCSHRMDCRRGSPIAKLALAEKGTTFAIHIYNGTNSEAQKLQMSKAHSAQVLVMRSAVEGSG